MTVQRYVALGDSQSEGLLDPDGRGGYRGWADRFAEFVAAAGSPHLLYANLAIRGKLIGGIRTEQLVPAQDLRPDLVTVMAGLNDLLRPSADVDAMLADLDALLGAFPGATVLTNTFPDIGAISPLLRRARPRVEAYNAGIRASAGSNGALVVDFAARGVGADPRIWSPDRIHANPVGHALIAGAFADTLGLPEFADWSKPLSPARPAGRSARAATEARWVGGTLIPWLARRARGRSSGDGITAKRPRLVPVAPVYHLVAPRDWPAAGSYRPDSLDSEGFVHLSFADQLEATADRHYPDVSDLVAVELDAARLDAAIEVEDSYGSGTAYPHCYGPLPTAAATAVYPMRRTSAGWQLSPAGASARASQDR